MLSLGDVQPNWSDQNGKTASAIVASTPCQSASATMSHRVSNSSGVLLAHVYIDDRFSSDDLLTSYDTPRLVQLLTRRPEPAACS